MANNDVNNRRGKLGELTVASELVRSGCAVNFLSFMDVGLDLHVQLPADLKAPTQGQQSWVMSGRAAHVQVKSTTTRQLPSISVETARAWHLGAQAGIPTLVVAVIVHPGREELRFFDPLVIDRHLHTSAAKGHDAFKIPISEGEKVSYSELFERVAYWVENGTYYFSDVLGFVWKQDGAEQWESACAMIENLTLVFQRRFLESSAAFSVETDHTRIIDALIDAFLDEAGIVPTEIDHSPTAGYSHRDSLHIRVYDYIRDSGSEKHGWSEWVGSLDRVSPIHDREGALKYLKGICRTYGNAVAGRLTLPA